jgi:hypothetical protein
MYKVLVRKREGKRSLGIPRRRCVSGVRLAGESMVDSVDRWLTLVNTVMTLWFTAIRSFVAFV